MTDSQPLRSVPGKANPNPMKILVTGGAGFIGSNFIRHLLGSDEHLHVTNLDKLTEAGNLENLADVAEQYPSRYRFLRVDVADEQAVMPIVAEGFDALVNFAAESHVDRSIESPSLFVRSNYFGTYTLLEACRKQGIRRFLQISTDEVYGSVPEPSTVAEDALLQPSSPYSATKAAADLLVSSYKSTFGLPVLIVRCSNNYGPYQFPEKLIPLMIANAMEDQPLPVYGDGLNVRDWIYVEDCCRAIAQVLRHGRIGEIYHIGEVAPATNLELVRMLVRLLGKPERLITFVADRPGHDRRYALNCRKLREELGWMPSIALEEGLRRTVQWYQTHRPWLERCRSGSYRDYYDRHYRRRLETLQGLRQSSAAV